MSLWVPVLIAFSLGLLMVNVFRFNIFLVLAAVMVNIALASFIGPNGPRQLIWAAWLIALAELVAGVYKLALGNSKRAKRRRFVG